MKDYCLRSIYQCSNLLELQELEQNINMYLCRCIMQYTVNPECQRD